MVSNVEELVFDGSHRQFVDANHASIVHGSLYGVHISSDLLVSIDIARHGSIIAAAKARHSFIYDENKQYGVFRAANTVTAQHIPVLTYILTEILERKC